MRTNQQVPSLKAVRQALKHKGVSPSQPKPTECKKKSTKLKATRASSDASAGSLRATSKQCT